MKYITGLFLILMLSVTFAWYNDTTENDSCLTIESDKKDYYSYNGLIYGQLKIDNKCAKEINSEILLYGEDEKQIEFNTFNKINAIFEKDLDGKDYLTFKQETKSINNTAKKIKEIKTKDKNFIFYSNKESKNKIDKGITYYDFTIKVNQYENGEFAFEIPDYSFLDPSYSTSNTFKGGVYNGSFEYGLGSAKAGTADGNIIGDNNYWWECGASNSTTGTCFYDNTISYDGNKSLRIDSNMLATGGRLVTVNSAVKQPNTTWSVTNENKIIPINPNTDYILQGCYRATAADENRYTYLQIGLFNSAGTAATVSNYSTLDLTDVNTWFCDTIYFTTPADSVSAGIRGVVGSTKIGDFTSAWFDSIRLTEIKKITLTNQQVGRPLITATGVDFNRINLNAMSSAWDINVNNNYFYFDVNFLGNDNNLVYSNLSNPLFYYGDNNVYVSNLNDLNFDNNYPALQVKLTFDFNTPTTAMSGNNAAIDWNRLDQNIIFSCVPCFLGGVSIDCNVIMYRIDSNDWLIFDQNVLVTDGNHLIEYYSIYINGNSENINSSIVLVDTIPPTTSFNLTGQTVNLTCIDTWSGCKDTNYSINNGAWQTYTSSITLTNGTYDFNYYSIDNAGNIETMQHQEITIIPMVDTNTCNIMQLLVFGLVVFLLLSPIVLLYINNKFNLSLDILNLSIIIIAALIITMIFVAIGGAFIVTSC